MDLENGLSNQLTGSVHTGTDGERHARLQGQQHNYVNAGRHEEGLEQAGVTTNSQLQDQIAALTVPGQLLPTGVQMYNGYLPQSSQLLSSNLIALNAQAAVNQQIHAQQQVPMAIPPAQPFETLQPPLMSIRNPTKTFWKDMQDEIEAIDFTKKRSPALPLARVRKVMRLDEDVKMIGAEVPELFGMACTLFIREMTLRAWRHTVAAKRKTLSRADIATAVAKTRTFDFLIDFVPPDPKLRTYHHQYLNQQSMPGQQPTILQMTTTESVQQPVPPQTTAYYPRLPNFAGNINTLLPQQNKQTAAESMTMAQTQQPSPLQQIDQGLRMLQQSQYQLMRQVAQASQPQAIQQQQQQVVPTMPQTIQLPQTAHLLAQQNMPMTPQYIIPVSQTNIGAMSSVQGNPLLSFNMPNQISIPTMNTAQYTYSPNPPKTNQFFPQDPNDLDANTQAMLQGANLQFPLLHMQQQNDQADQQPHADQETMHSDLDFVQ